MTSPTPATHPGGPGRQRHGAARDPDAILRIAMRVGVAMLASGAQSDEVEDAINATTVGLGLVGVQAAVTFSTISISYYSSPDLPPATLLHLVRDRRTDFARLAAVSALVQRVQAGDSSLDDARRDLEAISKADPPYGPMVAIVASALSAGGATIVFGGDWQETLATIVVALAAQAILRPLDRTRIQPFFRAVISAGMSTLLVAAITALVAFLGIPLGGGLVLTGSLLRFLPGYALVSGFRDLLGESILSGTARIAEALLLGAGIASGVAIGLGVAGAFGIELELLTIGQRDPLLLVALAAAFVLVAGFAMWLGEPPRTVGLAAVIGSIGWLTARPFAVPYGPLDPSLALLAAALIIGALGRLASRRTGAPSALWIVPAIMPLLPGLAIVEAMLGVDDAARLTGLVGAGTSAFVLGTGVATGDLLLRGALRVRDRVVAPAVGAAVEGVDTLVIQPAARVVRRPRSTGRPSGTPGGQAEGRPATAPADDTTGPG